MFGRISIIHVPLLLALLGRTSSLPGSAGIQEVPEDVYVSVAEALVEDLPDKRFVCVRPQFLGPGSPPMTGEVRRVLEENGWEFYDAGMPADTTAVLLVFSEAKTADGRVQVVAGFSGKYVSRAVRRVNTWTTTWRFDVRCTQGECTVEEKARWVEMDGVLRDPEGFLAGNVGSCTGTAPGRIPDQGADQGPDRNGSFQSEGNLHLPLSVLLGEQAVSGLGLGGRGPGRVAMPAVEA